MTSRMRGDVSFKVADSPESCSADRATIVTVTNRQSPLELSSEMGAVHVDSQSFKVLESPTTNFAILNHRTTHQQPLYKSSHSEAVIDYDAYKAEWEEWAKLETPSSWRKYRNYLDRFLSGKRINKPEELASIFNGDRNLVNAVRNFLKFLLKQGIRKKSELIDFQAVIPNIRTRERSEVEKYVDKQMVIDAYNAIKGDEAKKARQLAFKLLVFTGLRETEVLALMNQFDERVLDYSYKAFNLEHLKDKIAIYDLDQVEIPTRKHDTKRGYIALFPIELVEELREFKKSGYEVKKKTIEPERMYTKEFLQRDDIKDKAGRVIINAKLRKFHMNFLNDNAYRVEDKPADVDKIIEFIQGRTARDVGGRNYRQNVQAAAKFYAELVDEFKKTVPIFC